MRGGVPRVPLVCKAKSRICNSSKGRVMRRMIDSSWIPVLTCKMNKKCNVLWPEKMKMSGASVIMIC